MEKTFEENIKELEQITKTLEGGNLSLEESIQAFEKGIKLSKKCSEKLDNAEKRINILVQNEDKIEEKSFETEE